MTEEVQFAVLQFVFKSSPQHTFQHVTADVKSLRNTDPMVTCIQRVSEPACNVCIAREEH